MKKFIRIFICFLIGIYAPYSTADSLEKNNITPDEMLLAGLFPNNRPFSNTHNNTVRMVQKRKLPQKRKIDESWEYRMLLKDLKRIISVGRIESDDNKEKLDIFTYWQIGQRIYKEQEVFKNDPAFTNELFTCLERDLHFDQKTLTCIVRFYRSNEIVASIPLDLSWEHYVLLMNIEDKNKRTFYKNNAIHFLWDAHTLTEKIESNLYEKTRK